MLGQSGFYVYDVNPRGRWASGHVPGARNLDPADFTHDDLPADKDVILVFYCKDRSCGASRYAAWRAKGMGYRKVFVMTAGIEGWLQAGLKVEQS